MATTPANALPYPGLGDAPNGPSAVQALAERLEVLRSADSSTYALLASPALTGNPTAPTAAPGDNDTSIATTAFTAAAVAAYQATLEAAWTAYTPATTALTIGNGTLTAAFKKTGKDCRVRIKFTLGSTSAVGSTPTFSMPAGCAPATTQVIPCVYDDVNAAPSTGAASVRFTSNDIIPLTSNNVVSATTPFAWAVGDQMILSGMVEVL